LDSPAVSILIANYDGREALQLCLESILARTTYPEVKIVIGNCPASGSDREYLGKIKDRIPAIISIVSLEKDMSHGEVLTQLIKSQGRETPYVVTLDSDCEILSGDWIDIMLSQLQGPKDVIVAKHREGGLIGNNALITRTLWLCCALFVMENYRKIESDDNLPEGMTPFDTYPHRRQFRYLPGLGWDRQLGIETAGRLADRLVFDNKFGFETRPLPPDFFDTRVRHFGGMSRNHWRPEHPEIAPRWAEIKRRLAELRIGT
jgi:glycosyltransferase involved in cell wall biosynthesis